MAVVRRQRKDAARNASLVLEAAAQAFGTGGLAVDMREIARQAGVGIGTLYRHYPTKEELLVAVLQADLAVWTERTSAVDSADAYAALRSYLVATLSTLAERRTLLDGLAVGDAASPAFAACGEHLRTTLGPLVARAHTDGALRADVTLEDVGLLIVGLSRVVQIAPHAWERQLDLALEGFRTSSRDRTKRRGP